MPTDILVAAIQSSHARWTAQDGECLPEPRSILRTSRWYVGLPRLNDLQSLDSFTGGGGTFGVVLESTILASPRVTLQTVILSFTPPANNSTLNKELWTILADNGLTWANEGWGGFSTSGVAILINPNSTQQAAASSMAPLITFGQSLIAANVTGAQLLVTEFPCWQAFFDVFTGSHVAVRLLRSIHTQYLI